LHAAGVSGVTVTEVRGHGRQLGHSATYHDAEHQIDYLPKARLEIVVDDGEVDKTVETIMEHARTGSIGDGKYWVIPVEAVGRIRTGEVGYDAL
jgi:nitrogen regulatory protein P-II 1